MKKRMIIALGFLAIGVVATWELNSWRQYLQLLSQAGASVTAEASVYEVLAPTIKKGESADDAHRIINFSYDAPKGTSHYGSFTESMRDSQSNIGDKILVRYLRIKPQVFVRESEWSALSSQVNMLQYLVPILGTITMFLPFIYLGLGRK